MKLLFFPIVPVFGKSVLYLKASAAYLYDKNSAKLNISMEGGLSVTDRKKTDAFGEKLSR